MAILTKLAPLAALLALCLSPGCNSFEPIEGDDTIRGISAQLVDAAGLRADTRRVVALVAPIRDADDDGVGAQLVSSGRDDPLAIELSVEFVQALADHIVLIETQLDSTWSSVSYDDARLAEQAAELGASHLVLGSYFRHGNRLDVTLRLVDLRTRVIIAVAQGNLAIDALSKRAADALQVLDTTWIAEPGDGQVGANPSEPFYAAAMLPGVELWGTPDYAATPAPSATDPFDFGDGIVPASLPDYPVVVAPAQGQQTGQLARPNRLTLGELAERYGGEPSGTAPLPLQASAPDPEQGTPAGPASMRLKSLEKAKAKEQEGDEAGEAGAAPEPGPGPGPDPDKG